MQPQNGIQTLLSLRKLTRVIAEAQRSQMMEYLATLTPLFRAKSIFGDYIQGGTKEPARRADKAFKDLQALYEAIAPARPFNLPRELRPPLDVAGIGLEVSPDEYAHQAEAGGERRTITVRSPLTWVLTYSDHSPGSFKEILHSKGRNTDQLQHFLLSYLAIHIVTTSQPGLMQMLDALHFPVTTGKSADFAELPITRIGTAISTSKPSDALMLQSADMTGMDAFEEVINVEDIANLRNPQKDRLLELVRTHAPELLPAVS